jgi:hypothetical protein
MEAARTIAVRILLCVPVIVAVSPSLQAGLAESCAVPAHRAGPVGVLPLRVLHDTSRLKAPELRSIENAVSEKLSHYPDLRVFNVPEADPRDMLAGGACTDVGPRCLAFLGAQIGADRVILVEVADAEAQLRVHVTIIEVATLSGQTAAQDAATTPDALDAVSVLIETFVGPDPRGSDRVPATMAGPGPGPAPEPSPVFMVAAAAPNVVAESSPRNARSVLPILPVSAVAWAGLRGGSVDVGAADGILAMRRL